MKKLLLTFAFIFTIFFVQSQTFLQKKQEEAKSYNTLETASLIYLYSESKKHHEMVTVYLSETYPDGIVNYWATWHENTAKCDVKDMGDHAILTINYSWGGSEKFKIGSVDDDPTQLYMQPMNGGEKKIFKLMTEMP